MTIRLKYTPRVYAWSDVVDDLSDQVCAEDGWMSVNDVRRLSHELCKPHDSY